MRVAFAIFKFFRHGGAARDLSKIVSTCRERGHDVRIYALEWEGAHLQGVETVVMPTRGVRSHVRQRRFADQVADHVAAYPVDVVVGLNKMPGLDVYYAADSCFEDKARNQRPWVYRLSSRYRHYAEFEQAVFAEHARTRIMTIAPGQDAAFKAVYRTPAYRFHSLPPGIERDRGTASPEAGRALRTEFGVAETDILLLFVGSGFVKKGLDRVLRGVAALPAPIRERVRLVVVGDDKAERFKRLARRLQVAARVRFVGGRDDVAAWLQAADALALPAYDEAAGMVILEAASAGVPVVATANCGYAALLREAKAGIVTPVPFDQARFNADLERLLIADERKPMSRNGRELAANESLYAMAPRAVDVLETVGHSRNSRARRTSNRWSANAPSVAPRTSARPRRWRRPSHDMRAGEAFMQNIYLRDDLAAAARTGEFCAPGDDLFSALSALDGEVYRRAGRRRTSRVVIAGKTYFAKVHGGVGWREIAKNVLAGKRPVLGARQDFEASRWLGARRVAVPEAAAFGERGFNPARRHSFVIHDALEGFRSLEDVGHGWLATPPCVEQKRAVLTEAGRLTAAMHAAGVCHRDYYACHLMANAAKLDKGEAELAVIDLHRARVHRRLPGHARIRDLGALLFSTSAMSLTERDRMRFVAAYAGTPASAELRRRGAFWRAVLRRAERLNARAFASGVATGAQALAGAGIPSVGRLANLDRDPPLPFRFDATFGKGGVRTICTAVLRAQPGRRLVLRAVADGREMILKAFFGLRAGRDWRREKRGVTALRQSGVATPELLGTGRGGGARILAFEVLDDAREPSVDDVGKLLAALARMHASGIRQRDLHPGNFLVSGTRLFAIDGGGVAVFRAVGSARRLSDVARLLAHFPSDALGSLTSLTAAYEDAAGVDLPKRPVDDLYDRVGRARRDRLAKFTAKTDRECTAFSVREEPRRRIVVERRDDDPQLKEIIADPDRAAATGQALKRGNTAVAFRCGDFVVKQYNVKDRWHRFRLRWRDTRALRAWRAGHGLRFAGLATPQPRALIEMHSPQVGEAVAFLVVDHVEGVLLDLVDRALVDPDLNGVLARMFAAWRELRFVHGDTKASNFVVKDGQIHVLDLDAAAFYRSGWRFARAHRRDRVRFLANWPDPPATFRDALGGAGERA